MRIAVLTALLAVGPARAQDGPEYGFPPGDTLRYSERTDGRVTIETPNGPAQVTSVHVATIAVTRTAGDTARAWYESLLLRSAGPGAQRKEPNTEGLLRAPFTLSISGRGTVRLHAFPQMPESIAEITDLTRQFDDFFITLPATTLKPGLTWSDTLFSTRPSRPRDTFSSRHVRSYRVERDTVVGGVPAVIIRLDQTLQLDASSPLEDGVAVHSTLEGMETGTAIFAPTRGRLVARSRTGSLRGMFRMTSPSGRAEMPQSYDYTSTLSLAP